MDVSALADATTMDQIVVAAASLCWKAVDTENHLNGKLSTDKSTRSKAITFHNHLVVLGCDKLAVFSINGAAQWAYYCYNGVQLGRGFAVFVHSGRLYAHGSHTLTASGLTAPVLLSCNLFSLFLRVSEGRADVDVVIPLAPTAVPRASRAQSLRGTWFY